MKRLLLIFALLSACVSAYTQAPARPKNAPLPTIPAAVGKQERTKFYDRSHALCATLVEIDHGNWYVYFNMGAFPGQSAAPPDIVSPAFYTHAGHPDEGRAEAVNWALHFCRGAVTK